MPLLPALAAMAFLAPVVCEETDPGPGSWRVVQTRDQVAVSAATRADGAWGAAEGPVQASVGGILQHLTDFAALPDVVPWLGRVRVLARAPAEALVYFRYHLPWPLADRDYTARYRWARSESGDERVEIFDRSGPVESPGTVHVTAVRGCFTLSPLGPEQTWVSYVIHADVGGLLPSRIKAETTWKLALGTVLGIRGHFAGAATSRSARPSRLADPGLPPADRAADGHEEETGDDPG